MAATGLSQPQVYRYMKEIRQETKTLNGSKHKLSARTKKANKEIAEKKVIEQIKQNEGVEISIARTKEGTIYETKENN